MKKHTLSLIVSLFLGLMTTVVYGASPQDLTREIPGLFIQAAKGKWLAQDESKKSLNLVYTINSNGKIIETDELSGTENKPNSSLPFGQMNNNGIIKLNSEYLRVWNQSLKGLKVTSALFKAEWSDGSQNSKMKWIPITIKIEEIQNYKGKEKTPREALNPKAFYLIKLNN